MYKAIKLLRAWLVLGRAVPFLTTEISRGAAFLIYLLNDAQESSENCQDAVARNNRILFSDNGFIRTNCLTW
jgi:hypothetical protein